MHRIDPQADGTLPRPGQAVSRRAVDAVGLWCLAGYAVLAWLSIQPGEPGLASFFSIIGWTALPVFGLYLFLGKVGGHVSVERLLLWALLFRLAGLIGGPLYEDDFYRYLWDGYRFAASGSPYGPAPEAFFGATGIPESFERILDRINHPELATIYGPTTQLAFLLAYWLCPGELAALQLLLVGVDIALIALLLRLAPTRGVLLYAWCPLVIKEIAFTAHPDGLGVCLAVAAVVLAGKRSWHGAAVCLGLAAGAKIFALALVPFLLMRARLRHWLTFGATLAALYMPFTLDGAGIPSLLVFAREWEFNAAIFALLRGAMPGTAATAVAAVLGAAFLGWLYWRQRQRPPDSFAVPRGDWIFGVLLALSPVINAWYLLWLLPFAAVYPSPAWTASVAVMLSYVTGLQLNDFSLSPYEQPMWVRLLEFGAVGVALMVTLHQGRSRGAPLVPLDEEADVPEPEGRRRHPGPG